ncbi:MAG: peptide-methionine (S)-S-oxide reductase MsrA [Verrucomicrobia bacterium]|nr:peptide-methionine (S)-S-oxide reductase MsrA [Verrucomicrobiota bacterium]
MRLSALANYASPRGLALALIVLLNFISTTPPMNAAPEPKPTPPAKTQLATFGGGCFWCLEALFETFEGVKAVTSGYSAGKVPNPTYQQVCGGDTGHAEVVQIEFDPAKISYEQLLAIFWDIHDPTTLNRQGADVGTQYRSIILTHDDAQKTAAEKSKQAAGAKFKTPITTEIAPLVKYYLAEDYHQDYFRKNPNVPYCAYVISPKLQKLQKSKYGK